MFGWNVWTTVETMGTSIQIPARAPGLPANLWIHYAFNQTDWSDFPSNGELRSDWSRTTVMGGVGVEPGDIPVASLCCLGIAGIQRETQGIFDTDDWGVAFDTFAPSAPASLQFVGEMATSGKMLAGRHMGGGRRSRAAALADFSGARPLWDVSCALKSPEVGLRGLYRFSSQISASDG